MKIAVIGTGYVGLTTGACLSERGNEVLCMDIDKEKISDLKKGILPIYEPGLEEIVIRNIKQNRLNFTTNSKQAIEFADIVFSAVGTPQGKDHKADLKYVKEVAKEFGKYINSYKILVNKSTVPVGTGDLCREIIQKELTKREEKLEFDTVSNPEFLREGNAIKDTFTPDRIVIGTSNKKAEKLMRELYKKVTENGVEIILTDLKTAEIIKYASNAMLATKISFINEIANFCEKSGGDIKTIAEGIGLDKRIGKHFLNAGLGYGGSCLPKDVKALIQTGLDYNYEFQIIKAADKVNDEQKKIIFKKLKYCLKTLKGKTIAIWGLSFKPGTDDMREAPSIITIEKLQKEGALVHAFDPVAEKNAKKILKEQNISFKNSPYSAAKDSDALLILTEWNEFFSIDLQKLKSTMKGNLIIDGRNIYNKEDLNKAGFKYLCVGQKFDKENSCYRQQKGLMQKNSAFSKTQIHM